MGENLDQGLKRLSRSKMSLPAGQEEVLRACNHALQVPTLSPHFSPAYCTGTQAGKLGGARAFQDGGDPEQEALLACKYALQVPAVSPTFCLLDAQGHKQGSLEALVHSRMGANPEQRLKELSRSNMNLLAGQEEALRACKHAGLVWHAFDHLRRILKVPLSVRSNILFTWSCNRQDAHQH